jgi:hypothetical protein
MQSPNRGPRTIRRMLVNLPTFSRDPRVRAGREKIDPCDNGSHMGLAGKNLREKVEKGIRGNERGFVVRRNDESRTREDRRDRPMQAWINRRSVYGRTRQPMVPS